MHSWLLENKELISIYTSILATMFTFAIPIILLIWTKKSDKKKESREQARIERDKQEQTRKEEQNYLIRYIEKYLFSTYDDYYNFEKIDNLDKLNDAERLKGLNNHVQKLTYILDYKSKKLATINFIIASLSYNYLRDYFNLFNYIVSESLVYKWKDQNNFASFYEKILEKMPTLVSIILIEEKQFEIMKEFFITTLLYTNSDEEKYVVECALKRLDKEQAYSNEQAKKMQEKQT